VKIKEILKENCKIASIEVFRSGLPGRPWTYRFYIIGMLDEKSLNQIVEAARKHGLELDGISTYGETLTLLFREADEP